VDECKPLPAVQQDRPAAGGQGVNDYHGVEEFHRRGGGLYVVLYDLAVLRSYLRVAGAGEGCTPY